LYPKQITIDFTVKQQKKMAYCFGFNPDLPADLHCLYLDCMEVSFSINLWCLFYSTNSPLVGLLGSCLPQARFTWSVTPEAAPDQALVGELIFHIILMYPFTFSQRRRVLF
jgi:hypothetical protein